LEEGFVDGLEEGFVDDITDGMILVTILGVTLAIDDGDDEPSVLGLRLGATLGLAEGSMDG